MQKFYEKLLTFTKMCAKILSNPNIVLRNTKKFAEGL